MHQRQDGLSDMFRQLRPTVLNESQFGVGLCAVSCIRCAAFCALGFWNRRFWGREWSLFASPLGPTICRHSALICLV